MSDEHFLRLARLLEWESQAEARQARERRQRQSAAQAERSGLSLLNLSLVEEEEWLGGRVEIALIKSGPRIPLPWTRLGLGSPVILSREEVSDHDGYRGVISERDDLNVKVALNELPGGNLRAGRWRIDMAYDEVATQRQLAALQRARHAKGDRLADLRDTLLGTRKPEFCNEWPQYWFNPRLNESQREAVAFALSAADVALIHGPPGTGKTTAVVELIRQAVCRGLRVLACAPSNRATDNLLERLAPVEPALVRLGHPARVLPELRKFTIDRLVEEHPHLHKITELETQAIKLKTLAQRNSRGKPRHRVQQAFVEQANRCLRKAQQLREGLKQRVLTEASVICATTTGLDAEVLGGQTFDLAVIDEACQSTEPGCWIPLTRAARVVLAGDHCQLAPTVISEPALRAGFGVSLFERIVELHGPTVVRRLEEQYRMHAAIMNFSSREFYDGTLSAHPSVAQHTLADLPQVAALPFTLLPLQVLDTSGSGAMEQPEPDGESRLNRGEADLVCEQVEALRACGLHPEQIAVITPYAAQVRLLRRKLNCPGLEVDSVDGFQGREKEAVVVSLVRSNNTGEIGFLQEIRRTNVALTRAKRKLIVIGDRSTLSNHPFYARLFHYFDSQQAVTLVPPRWNLNPPATAAAAH